MIKILDCKNSNYLSKLKLILEKRRLGSKVNTNIVIKIVKDIKKNKQNKRTPNKEKLNNFFELVFMKLQRLIKLIISFSVIGLYILINFNFDYQL